MVISNDRFLSDLQDVKDYADYRKMISYLQRHRSEYNDTDYDILMGRAEEIAERKFDPKDCSQIDHIYYRLKSGYMSREYSKMDRNRSIATCSDAHNLGETIPGYLYYLYPDLDTFYIEAHMPTEYERGLTRGVFRTPEERRPPHPEPEAETESEPIHREELHVTRVPVDVADLVNRLRMDMEELIEGASSDSRKELNKIRERINRLEDELETARRGGRKKITRVLDTQQYQYFTRNIAKLNLPVQQEKIARGEYRIIIHPESEEEEERALSFIEEAEKHQKESSAPKIRPEGFIDVLDALCSNFERRTGMVCGLNRTGSLSTLAEKIIEYARAHGTEPDALPITPSEMNLLPSGQTSVKKIRERRGIYTAEMADEAFNAYVSQLEGLSLTGRRGEEESSACSPDIISGYILDYDAVATIRAEGLLPSIPDTLKRAEEEAREALRRCGYYPDNLEGAREEAERFYRSMGTSYDDQFNAQLEDYVNRYGET